jgi:putative transcriptional regulator
MQHDDLLEALLAPCVPSEVQRRDEELLRRGVTPQELAAAKSAVASAAGVAAPALPGSSLRARLLSSVSRKGRHGAYVDRVARIFRITQQEAAEVLARAEDPASFVPSPIPGVDVVPVQTAAFPGAIAAVARIPAGMAFPHHGHVGDETMLILEGGLREDDGREAWRGDEIVRLDGTSHSFTALPGEACIAVTLVEGTIELA